MNRSIFFTSLLSLCIAAPLAAGCAAPTSEETEAADGDEVISETQDELTVAASQLVGSYWSSTPAWGGFGRLHLKSNGKYTAQVDPKGTALCITSPCLLPESGTWNATRKAGGGFRLRIRAAGMPSRWYDAVKAGSTLRLTAGGTTEVLNKLAPSTCLDDSDCSATQECAPKMCLMYCAVGDPFCCGTSVCRPKSPPPPPPPPPSSCWGAWLDQFGGCRTPADGVYPASCCEDLKGPDCGPTTCAAGQVCCNPLSGICTKPGDFCAM